MVSLELHMVTGHFGPKILRTQDIVCGSQSDLTTAVNRLYEWSCIWQFHISGVRFQYFVLRFGFGSLKNTGFRFGFAKPICGVDLISVLSFVLFFSS